MRPTDCSDNVPNLPKGDSLPIARWYPRMVSVAVARMPALLKDRFSAEDFVQETLLIGLIHWEKTEGRNDIEIEAWLLTILRNLIRMEVRRVSRKFGEASIHRERIMDLATLDDFVGLDASLGDFGLIHDESLRNLRARLDSLPDEMRQIVQWRYFDDHDFVWIGEKLGISDRQARRRLRKALDSIVSNLGQQLTSCEPDRQEVVGENAAIVPRVEAVRKMP